jgi:hypothetical protein
VEKRAKGRTGSHQRDESGVERHLALLVEGRKVAMIELYRKSCVFAGRVERRDESDRKTRRKVIGKAGGHQRDGTMSSRQDS